jgi:undecaprenyl-phosphate 4-deoxy-4-formamido-L-arabinose transferase
MKHMEISLVIPVYNEANSLNELVERCVRVCQSLQRKCEIILVDDGSRDGSRDMLAELAMQYPAYVVVVLLNRNYGQHPAVLAGLAEARGQIVVTLDADLQNPPEEIPKLIEKMDAGCDVVGSVRIDRQDSWLRRMPSRLINAIVRKSTGVMMSDYGCMLRAYRRNIVDTILQCPERSTFIPVLANSFASKTDEVPVRHAARKNDASKYSVWKLINLQFDLITSMTAFPLRLLSIAGGALALLGFAFGLLLVVMRIVHGPEWAAEGVLTVFAGLFVFTGFQFFALGLLGEYLGRTYDDVRARPRFVVQSVIRNAPDSATRIVKLSANREYTS